MPRITRVPFSMISPDEPVRRPVRQWGGLGPGNPGGYPKPRVPRTIGELAREPSTALYYAEMDKQLRKAPEDMTSRPTFPYPPALRKSGYYAPKSNPGSAGWRQGYAGIFRKWGLPDGFAKPFGVTVERRFLRKLIQEPYRSKHRPITYWNERPQPVFYTKTTRSIPVRPAVAYPSYNFRPYDEEKAIEQARARAGMRKR